MYEIDTKLEQREHDKKPIQVALVGAGQMGTEIITQVGEMVGMEIAVVVDLSPEIAVKGYSYSKKQASVALTNDLAEAAAAVAAGQKIATTNYKIATALPQIDAVIDATGSTEMGAIVALEAINHKKHIIMMSVECDITVGPILRQMAENAGVVYSLAAGDEPAATIELYRFAKALGFTIVAAGKGKNNPLNIYATPADVQAKADARKMSARMLCEFVDGSKTAIEMAAVSNATGLIPDIRGMHGAAASVNTLKDVFCLAKDGGVLNQIGVVDFAIGVHPGVFVIAHTNNQRIRDGLVQRDMGPGPYYTLFRPFHLCSVEVPLSVAQAVFYHESSGHPRKCLVSECIAVAKKDLKAGQMLDGIGEYCYRGSIERADIARQERLLPLGLAKGCILKADVPKDTVITYDLVTMAKESVLLQLRRIQDQLHV